MLHTLMVVDDSNIIRNRIERGFLNSQIQVVASAANGIEALEKFQTHRPEFVTMDLTMPQMDGLSCIKNLIAYDPSVSILVVSALSDKETALQALQYGARGFICKPFGEGQLIAAIERLIAIKQKSKTA